MFKMETALLILWLSFGKQYVLLSNLKYYSQYLSSRRYFSLILEKEMASHSSILACIIPGTAEPSRLEAMGSKSHT